MQQIKKDTNIEFDTEKEPERRSWRPIQHRERAGVWTYQVYKWLAVALLRIYPGQLELLPFRASLVPPSLSEYLEWQLAVESEPASAQTQLAAFGIAAATGLLDQRSS